MRNPHALTSRHPAIDLSAPAPGHITLSARHLQLAKVVTAEGAVVAVGEVVARISTGAAVVPPPGAFTGVPHLGADRGRYQWL